MGRIIGKVQPQTVSGLSRKAVADLPWKTSAWFWQERESTVRKVVTLAILLVSVFIGVAGASELFDARNAHAFSAMVVSLERAGFRYVMTDYHTDKPVWQRQFMGQARLTAMTVFDFDTASRYWVPGHPRAIAVGDIVKIYGIKRDGSADIAVYRLEDRGAR